MLKERQMLSSTVKFNVYEMEIGDIAGLPKNKTLVTQLAKKHLLPQLH
jgi:hypothetical protein